MSLQVSPAGAAGRDGRLRVGLRLLEVNQQSLLGLTHGEAVQLLRGAGDCLSVLVCDGFDASAPAPSEVSAPAPPDRVSQPPPALGHRHLSAGGSCGARPWRRGGGGWLARSSRWPAPAEHGPGARAGWLRARHSPAAPGWRLHACARAPPRPAPPAQTFPLSGSQSRAEGRPAVPPPSPVEKAPAARARTGLPRLPPGLASDLRVSALLRARALFRSPSLLSLGLLGTSCCDFVSLQPPQAPEGASPAVHTSSALRVSLPAGPAGWGSRLGSAHLQRIFGT